MPHFDLPLPQLRGYLSASRSPPDFREFWHSTLASVEASPLDARFERVDADLLPLIETYDVSFRGFAGQTVRGWLLLPAGASVTTAAQRLPCVITYVGYGSGRGLPVEHVAPVVAGFAHFVMDTRGQGGVCSTGDTPDLPADESGAPIPINPQAPGFMTRGIESPGSYYYRRVYADAVRAVSAAAAHPRVDGSRVLVSGASQGGGIALAVAALAPERVKLLCADMPFLCDFPRAVTITDQPPYSEIVRYLACHRARAETVFRTLSYFDCVNFAPLVRARSLFSAACMDQVCPPSTVFAAYNAVGAEKEIRVYEFNQHEGGGSAQTLERLRFTQRWL